MDAYPEMGDAGVHVALVPRSVGELELVEVTRERRVVVHPVIDARASSYDGRRSLPPPRRHGWTPADAVAAYRATLAGEGPGPSFDVYA
jgi:hypothetical protein